MKTTFFLFLLLSATVRADVVLDELKVNLTDAQKKVEQAKGQISDLEENDTKLKKNIQSLNTALDKKISEQKQAKDILNEYTQKIASTSSAKKEFEHALLKDKQELESVQKDLLQVEKKLAALKAAKKALDESIDISEDNLSKMNDRSTTWQKNKESVQNELTSLEKDVAGLDTQKDAQEKTRLENQQSLNKWKKALASQESAYQKLDSKYRQAVREADKKAQEK